MNPLALLDTAETTGEAVPDLPLIKTHYDEKYRVAWCFMNPDARPCFSPALLRNLMDYAQQLKRENAAAEGQKIDYVVLASAIKGVFNLGGDLDLFYRCVTEGDRESLQRYALDCINLFHEFHTHLGMDATSISLIQGDALGGGFESALGAQVVIAEKGCKLGFPEALFNLFPGMGAFTILSRKLGPAMAERMMLDGKLHSAEDMHEIGLVDILADPGEGEAEIYKLITKRNRQANSYRALRRVRDACSDYSYQEMKAVVDIWVDAAFQLDSRDLRMMERLIKRQNRIVA